MEANLVVLVRKLKRKYDDCNIDKWTSSKFLFLLNKKYIIFAALNYGSRSSVG